MGTGIRFAGALFAAVVVATAAATGSGAPAAPLSLGFDQQHARFVRVVILGTEGGAPARLDEVAIFGPEPGLNLALGEAGAQAAASSQADQSHSPAKLIDGRFGEESCWVGAGRRKEWIRVAFPRRLEVSRVVLYSDGDRRGMPKVLEVQLSLAGRWWKTVASRGRGVAPPAPPPSLATSAVPRSVPTADEHGFPNLALTGKASASSLLPGYAIHQVRHLNDGRYGNRHSWISRRDPSWAEIDLGGAKWVYKVALGSDSLGDYHDRAPTRFRIEVARESGTGPERWFTVARQDGGPPVHIRREFAFKPILARRVRIFAEATSGGQCRLDEVEVYGSKSPIPVERLGALAPYPPQTDARPSYEAAVRAAFLAEEHAWLKTFGRADLDARLTDYKRVWHYPRRVGGDVVPLPPLSGEPRLDGRLDDACWQEASRAAVRVAGPDDLERGPLVSHVLWAGWRGETLYLAIQTDRLLSRHLAVVSGLDWGGCGVVALEKGRLVFNRYSGGRRRQPVESRPIEGTHDPALEVFELALPLELFPDCRGKGLRVGLGMGGRHTRAEGRPVELVFSSLSLAEEPPCVGRTFRVRMASARALAVRGNVSLLREGLTLEPGKRRIIALPARRGPLGPELDLAVQDGSGEAFALHLFRYDPLERTLALMEDLIERLGRKGLDVRAERDEVARFRAEQRRLLSLPRPDPASEREAFFRARLAKRRLLLRDPGLAPLERVLCVKRQPFMPSHNYSVILDARGGPGGGIDIVEIPRRNGRLEPEAARVRRVFDAGQGIARNPTADFDARRIYFAYARAKGDYFHLMRINPDGTGLTGLTDGPFHDYFPSPLPDGGLAFISTRCRARYLCWRPQAAVLFRTDPDGGNTRPLSFANLTEWGPSVMRDGRIIWQRSEYVDKGADFGHTLWAIRPDGTHPELVFGNDIIQPNGYASGREVPGTSEICCVPISHFGDLNGPIALLDIHKGRFNPDAINTLTPEVPRPGLWPTEECFRDPYPIARDYILCAHAPRRRFALYLIDRYGNRELLYDDPAVSTMCATPFQARPRPPVLPAAEDAQGEWGEFFVVDVYRGISPPVKRGQARYIRVVQEVRADLERLPNGEHRRDHPSFMDWYATPVHKVSGPWGWPSYVAKASWGLARVETDGSARFLAPAGKQLYLELLDENLNELQRMRSVVQLRPGERRGCIGCHEPRSQAPPARLALALAREPQPLQAADWEQKPFSYERVVQPVLDARCVRCHNANHKLGINLVGSLDAEKVPVSYRTLVSRGLVHYADCRYNPGGCEKVPPLSLGTWRSRLSKVLDGDHHDLKLTRDEVLRIKTWIDLNCPLWPDYLYRPNRSRPATRTAQKR